MIQRLKKLKNCFTEYYFWNHFVLVGFVFQNVNRPIRLKLDEVHDWISFFDPYINPHCGSRKVRMFRFEMQDINGNNKPMIFYKVDCLRLLWQGLNDNVGFIHMSGYPVGYPAFIAPNPILDD